MFIILGGTKWMLTPLIAWILCSISIEPLYSAKRQTPPETPLIIATMTEYRPHFENVMECPSHAHGPPEEAYETDPSHRPNVVFPTGSIVEDNGEVKLYYGAADLRIALATTTIDELLDFCLNPVPYEHPIPHLEDPKPARSTHA